MNWRPPDLFLVIAALIHPDGRLTALRGEITSDPASIAALSHAVHAAGNELAVRAGTAAAHCVTLTGPGHNLTLIPIPQGLLLLEHDRQVSLEALQAQAAEWLAGPALPSVMAVAPTLCVPAFSLADALQASAP